MGAIDGKLGTGTAVRECEFILDRQFLVSRHSSVRLPQDKSPTGDEHKERSRGRSWATGRGGSGWCSEEESARRVDPRSRALSPTPLRGVVCSLEGCGTLRPRRTPCRPTY